MNLENTRLLIIDDSLASLNIIEKILNSCGYTDILTAVGAWEGIDLMIASESAGEKLPDLILLDILMPQMNGIEAIQRLKSHPTYVEIPIVVISVKNDAATLAEAFEAGALDFISKPVSRPVLKARVDAIIKLKTEIDTRKKHEKELQVLNKSLMDLNMLKNRFLATAAHDLRGPLASVKGLAELLLEEIEKTLSEEQLEMLNMIYDTSDGMLVLVNDFLDVSVIESGNISLTKVNLNIKNILKNRLQLNIILAAKKNIKIKTDLENVGEIPVDKNRMEQVIDNLLSNAIKFSPDNTTIKVVLRGEEKYAVFSIEDQGVGIKEEDFPTLFGEFVTTRNKTTGGEKSTGLGLFIVKSIINAHKGILDVESVSGKGTKMIVKLPMESEL